MVVRSRSTATAAAADVKKNYEVLKKKQRNTIGTNTEVNNA